MSNHFIIIAIQPCSTEGKSLLGEELFNLLSTHLQDSISNSSIENRNSRQQVLIFRFERLVFALSSIYGALESFRENILPPTYTKPLPVRFILHLQETNNDETIILDNPEADFWSPLHYEKLYITRPLKLKWPQLLAGKKDISCKMSLGDEGLYRVDFAKKPDFYTVTLFTHRNLPLQGNEIKECFYCGMNSHTPTNCPSKLLDLKDKGLKTLGYHSFHNINNTFEKVFKDPQKLLTPAKPNKQKLSSLVRLAYYDIFHFFQMRFLFKMSFSVFPKWEAALTREKTIVSDNNLNLALDCLRVGKYDIAEERLKAATAHKQEKLFFGYVGLAFLALEKGRYNDMGYNLDTALTNSSSDREKVYINILLYRFFKVTGDLWKAQHHIKALLKLKPDLIEAKYYNILIDLACGFCEKGLSVMQSLVNGPKEFFMTLLLDPQLLPMQGFIDEMLQAKVEAQTQEATQQIARARAAAEDLKLWLAPDDKELAAVNDSLIILEEQHQSGNYYDIVDICNNSKKLCQTCRETRDSCLDTLADRRAVFLKQHKHYTGIWRLFLFKRFFNKTDQTLNKVSSKLVTLDKLIKKDNGESYQRAQVISNEIKEHMRSLDKSFKFIQSLEVFILHTKLFAKKVLITEAIALALLLVIFIAFTFLGWNPTEGSPLIQKNFILLLFFLIAPIIGFVTTLIEIKKKSLTTTKPTSKK